VQEPTDAEREAKKRKLGLVRIARYHDGQLLKAHDRHTNKLAYVWKATDPLPPAFPKKPGQLL
jgi:hypothetical protein